MNKIELHLMYKNETSEQWEPMTANAYMSKKSFDMILESDDLDLRIIEMLPHSDRLKGRYTTITFEDPEYVKWMEQKLLETLQSLSEASEVKKRDWDSAMYEIDNLRNQLEQAEDELRDLQYEFRSRT